MKMKTITKKFRVTLITYALVKAVDGTPVVSDTKQLEIDGLKSKDKALKELSKTENGSVLILDLSYQEVEHEISVDEFRNNSKVKAVHFLNEDGSPTGESSSPDL